MSEQHAMHQYPTDGTSGSGPTSRDTGGESGGVAVAPNGEAGSEAWDSVADGFDRFVTPSNMTLGEHALRLVELGAGERFLDVAAGSGALSLPAARLGARVLAVDFAPVMVDRLRARADREGLDTLEARVMDGQALDLEDQTFDVAASQFGVMLFPDLRRGIAELARVTRPGGRVLILAMGPPDEIEFLRFFIGGMRAAIPGFTGLPKDPPPLPFRLSDPDRFRRELAAVGLTDVRVERFTHEQRFGSGQEFWNWFTSSNPIGANMVANLTPEQSHTVRQALHRALRERAGGSGPAVLKNTVHIGIATK